MADYPSSDPALTGCTFTNDSASRSGGGMYNDESSPAVTGCTFDGDEAPGGDGGGMWNHNGSSPTLTNCTFEGDEAVGGYGGAIEDNSTTKLINCILWANFAETGNEVYGGTTVTYSDVEGGSAGMGNINADPLFVSRTNLQLQAGSPCISSGSLAAIEATGVTTDLAGNPRVVNGAVGMGAYEFQPSLLYASGSSINWNDAANWADDQLPTSSSNVVIPSGAQVTLGPGISYASSLTLQGNATLDLTSGSLAIDYGSGADPISTIQSDLATGYNAGAWNGSGIVSSTVAGTNKSSNLKYAVGYIDGATPPLNDPANTVSSGEIEIMPTLAGDARLSGTVSFYDFQLVLSNFGKPSQSWDQGDFDYSGTVDFYDFQVVLSNFGQNSSAVTQTITENEVGNQMLLTSNAPLAILPGGADDTILGVAADRVILPD